MAKVRICMWQQMHVRVVFVVPKLPQSEENPIELKSDNPLVEQL